MNIAQVVQFIATGAWLVVIVLVVLLVMRSSRGQAVKGFTTGLVVLVLAALVLSTVGAGLVFIEPDEMAVVITAGQGGIRPEPLTAGIHFVIPFIERVERFSILRQTYTMSATGTEGQVTGDDSIQVRTKDGQQVFIDASVIYSIDPTKAINLYRTWRKSFEDGLVRPQSRGVIRDISSQFGVEEIVSSKRADMEKQITDNLTRIFADNNLILQDFVLRNIRFSDEYAKAVEQKQIAEQQAQQAKFVVESKKQEAEQARQTAQGAADAAVIAAKGAAEARIVQAEAEAKALQLIAEVLKQNPSLLQYQYITKLAPNVQMMLVPSNAPFILPQLQLSPTATPTATP
ncbi:MAG TPA: prohibitin family protein [Anaerolineales bacterium]|jgi:regulator of protease activity HflC (stomatin/prohibitin superfamily)